jgi:predicted DNA-binding transcriptional regulator AlpA
MDMETPKFIRPHQLAKILGVSTVTLWRWRKERILPEPMSIGPRFIGWQPSIIEQWINDQNITKDTASNTVK